MAVSGLTLQIDGDDSGLQRAVRQVKSTAGDVAKQIELRNRKLKVTNDLLAAEARGQDEVAKKLREQLAAVNELQRIERFRQQKFREARSAGQSREEAKVTALQAAHYERIAQERRNTVSTAKAQLQVEKKITAEIRSQQRVSAGRRAYGSYGFADARARYAGGIIPPSAMGIPLAAAAAGRMRRGRGGFGGPGIRGANGTYQGRSGGWGDLGIAYNVLQDAFYGPAAIANNVPQLLSSRLLRGMVAGTGSILGGLTLGKNLAFARQGGRLDMSGGLFSDIGNLSGYLSGQISDAFRKVFDEGNVKDFFGGVLSKSFFSPLERQAQQRGEESRKFLEERQTRIGSLRKHEQIGEQAGGARAQRIEEGADRHISRIEAIRKQFEAESQLLSINRQREDERVGFDTRASTFSSVRETSKLERERLQADFDRRLTAARSEQKQATDFAVGTRENLKSIRDNIERIESRGINMTGDEARQLGDLKGNTLPAAERAAEDAAETLKKIEETLGDIEGQGRRMLESQTALVNERERRANEGMAKEFAEALVNAGKSVAGGVAAIFAPPTPEQADASTSRRLTRQQIELDASSAGGMRKRKAQEEIEAQKFEVEQRQSLRSQGFAPEEVDRLSTMTTDTFRRNQRTQRREERREMLANRGSRPRRRIIGAGHKSKQTEGDQRKWNLDNVEWKMDKQEPWRMDNQRFPGIDFAKGIDSLNDRTIKGAGHKGKDKADEGAEDEGAGAFLAAAASGNPLMALVGIAAAMHGDLRGLLAREKVKAINN